MKEEEDDAEGRGAAGFELDDLDDDFEADVEEDDRAMVACIAAAKMALVVDDSCEGVSIDVGAADALGATIFAATEAAGGGSGATEGATGRAVRGYGIAFGSRGARTGPHRRTL